MFIIKGQQSSQLYNHCHHHHHFYDAKMVERRRIGWGPLGAQVRMNCANMMHAASPTQGLLSKLEKGAKKRVKFWSFDHISEC